MVANIVAANGASRRIKVIVNPSAHSGRAWKHLKDAGVLDGVPSNVSCEWVESRSPEHLAELVERAQHEELDAVGLAGGDGTVTLALAGLRGPNRVPLGLLPVGSGNDFAKDCGVPRETRAAFSALLTGVPRAVDVARCTPNDKRYCCVAAVGLDELALRIIYSSKWKRSKALNMYAALRALASYEARPVRLTWEGGEFEGEVMFAAVTNTRSYGGGFMVSPGAQVDDGKLDLCIVRRTGRLRLLSQFPRILKGTHGQMEEVLLASSPWVRIEAVGEPLPVPLDGELGMSCSPVELRCEPRALNVLVPAPGVN
jgi:diacylglycerol kinase (ATP)